MRSPTEKVMAIVRQSRFFFAVPPIFAIVSVFVAAKNYNLAQLFSAILSLLFIWTFTSSVNNTYDILTDQGSQLMKFQNPLVTGELSFREAHTMNLISPLLSLLVGAFAGPYWIGLPLIAILLVVLYDLKPLRLKDTTFGFLIAPLCQCLPFLFGYAAATSSFIFPTWFLSVLAFLYFNGVVVSRFLPDMELDLRLGIHNFSTVFGAEATRRIDIASTVLTATMPILGVFLGGLSPLGIPLLLLSVTLQLRVLAQGAEALRNPAVFRRFAMGMLPNSALVALSIVYSAL